MNKNKKLQVKLLTEKLEKLLGRKVMFKEDMINVSKDFEPDADKNKLITITSAVVDKLEILVRNWKQELVELKDGTSSSLSDKESMRDAQRLAEKLLNWNRNTSNDIHMSDVGLN